MKMIETVNGTINETAANEISTIVKVVEKLNKRFKEVMVDYCRF